MFIPRIRGYIGGGLLELPYHNALCYECKERELSVQYNAPFPVFYKGKQVGEYFADLVVGGKVIVEVKSVGKLTEVHKAQLVNYMCIAGLRVDLLVNFHGVKAEWQRFVV